jgi:hypothetical protein
VQRISELKLLVTANIPSSLILSTLMKETILSSKKAVLTKETRRHIPEDGICNVQIASLAKRVVVLMLDVCG